MKHFVINTLWNWEWARYANFCLVSIHRIRGWLRLGGTSRDHLVLPPCSSTLTWSMITGSHQGGFWVSPKETKLQILSHILSVLLNVPSDRLQEGCQAALTLPFCSSPHLPCSTQRSGLLPHSTSPHCASSSWGSLSCLKFGACPLVSFHKMLAAWDWKDWENWPRYAGDQPWLLTQHSIRVTLVILPRARFHEPAKRVVLFFYTQISCFYPKTSGS